MEARGGAPPRIGSDKIADASRHAGFAGGDRSRGGIVATPDRRELPDPSAFWKTTPNSLPPPPNSRSRLGEEGEFREIDISSSSSSSFLSNPGERIGTWTARGEFKRGRRSLVLESISRWIRLRRLVRHCRVKFARAVSRSAPWTGRGNDAIALLEKSSFVRIRAI